jgi:hypothetical protein
LVATFLTARPDLEIVVEGDLRLLNMLSAPHGNSLFLRRDQIPDTAG